jgi:hypothetical protein
LKRITASIHIEGGVVYAVKTCGEHGRFTDIVSHDADYHKEVRRVWNLTHLPDACSPATGGENACLDCLSNDRQGDPTSAAFIEVTHRCNLDCWICYADSGRRNRIPDPSAEQIVRIMKAFRDKQSPPPKRLQLSGGEPTIRDDLPDLVRHAVKLGFEEIGLNTNGIRLAQDIDLCKELIKSGVNKISLQFDGVDDATYRAIRRVDLYRYKLQVIENVRKIGRGVVQLVCAVAKGVNDHEIPGILDFAADNADVVSGISFLPVALCGREFDRADVLKYRVTTPYVQSIINRHTNGVCQNWPSTYTLIRHLRFVLHFLDGRPIADTSHPECGSLQVVYATREKGKGRTWHSLCDLLDYPKIEEESERLWTRYQEGRPNGTRGVRWRIAQARTIGIAVKNVKNKRLAVRAVTVWSVNRLREAIATGKLKSLGDLQGLFRNSRHLILYCSSFQDLYSINLERIERCGLHVGYYDPIDDKVRMVPFCAMNTVHRKTIEKRLLEFAERPSAIAH